MTFAWVNITAFLCIAVYTAAALHREQKPALLSIASATVITGAALRGSHDLVQSDIHLSSGTRHWLIMLHVLMLVALLMSILIVTRRER